MTATDCKVAKNVEVVSDYLIDGKPTKHTGAYAGTKATVVDGFDGNPDVKAAEASDVRKSDIRNDGDSANDIYNVADVASKIDDNGAGDIVAVYMYDDDMGEKISIKGVSIALTANTITVGQDKVEVEVKLGTTVDSNLDVKNMYVQVVDKDGKVVITKTNVTDAAQKLVLNTKDLKEGTYTVQLFGYNKTDKNHDLLAEATLTVGAKVQSTVTKVEFTANAAGDPSDKPVVLAGTQNTFYVKLTADPAVTALTDKDMTVSVGNVECKFTAYATATPNVFEIRVDGVINQGAKVDVVLKAGGVLTGTMPAPATGNAEQGTTPPPTSPDAVKAGEIKVKVGDNSNELNVQVLEGTGTHVARAARAAGQPITTLTSADFKVTVGSQVINDIEATYDMSEGVYNLISKSVSNWEAPAMKDITITVGNYSETYKEVAVDNAIEDTNNTATFIKGSGKDVKFTPTLTNLTMDDVQVKSGAKVIPVLGKDGVVTVPAAELDKQSAGQVKFTLESKEASTVNVEYTITVKNAPALTDPLNAKQTAGTKAVNEVKATATYPVTTATKDTAVVIVKGADSFSKEVSVTLPDAVAANAADAIRKALDGDAEVKAKYDITGATDKIILTAKAGVDGENVTLEVKNTDAAKLTLGSATATQEGVAAKQAAAGTLKFTVPAGGTEDATYTLTIDGPKTKSATIAVKTGMTAEQIAGLIVTEVKKISELDVSNTGDQVTITEKAGNEGAIFADTTATDVAITKN